MDAHNISLPEQYPDNHVGKTYHTPVLLKESIDGLNITADGIYVDATFGGGGYSKEILKRLNENGRLYAFDQDEDAFKNSINDPRFTLFHQNFRYVKNMLKFYGINQINGIVADLGISSYQIDTPEKGFSTRFDSTLDMRMDRRGTLSAEDILKTYSKEELVRIFRLYAEIDNAEKAAFYITKTRSETNISTTEQLKEAIKNCIPKNKESKYMAQLFQALRIEVNDELGALKALLTQSVELLSEGGRLVVISYHSLEDRLVKNFIRSGNLEGEIKKDFFGNIINPVKSINRKPITPSEEELLNNPRSRSGKLRIAEKTNDNER